MRWKIFVMALAISAGAMSGRAASAVTCAQGPYRAGCAGPNGAVVAHKQPYHPVYKPPSGSVYHGKSVSCASGPYRAGCVGPHGGVVHTH